MTPERRKQFIFAALALALLFLGWRQIRQGSFGTSKTVERAAGGPARGAVTANGVGNGDPLVVELRVGDLEREPGDYAPGRDPFRFGAPPPPPPPPPAEPDPDALRRAEEALAAQEPPEEATPPQPVPPPVDVVFLGSFGSAKRRLAVFSNGKAIFNVLEGGVLNEKFVVVRIGFESVDVGFVDFPDAPPERLAVGG
ncbi:MAG: hypothetical protein WBH85_15100 [Thermoanaerobaculia bacterium]